MTAATVTNRYREELAQEHVQLTVSDGETFVSRLSGPKIVQMSWSEDMDAEATTTTARPSYTISGRTITFQCANVTDKKLDVSIFGKL
jgi:hypothetical protein